MGNISQYSRCCALIDEGIQRVFATITIDGVQREQCLIRPILKRAVERIVARGAGVAELTRSERRSITLFHLFDFGRLIA